MRDIRVRLLLPLLFLGIVQTPVASAQPVGTFTATGNMTTPRFLHTATQLPNGKVLIVGGYTGCDSTCRPVASAELYDPASGTFAPTGRMTAAHTTGAVLLPDGRVLIAGADSTHTAPSLEIYDPTSGTFSAAGKTATLTGAVSTTLLNDGRVLLSGTVGTFPPGAELYDPASGISTPVANWPQFDVWFPLVLADGSVLLLSNDSDPEIYDAAAGTFRPLSSPYSGIAGSISHYYPVRSAILLLNGTVLFTGDNSFSNDRRAELYNPATGTFAATGSLSTARNFHSATLLPDGTVLVAGGEDQSGSRPLLATAEIYDPGTSGFSETGNLSSARYAHTATLLNSGQVLLTGGFTTRMNVSGTPVASAELYTPAVLVPAPVLFSLSGDGKGQGAIWHAQTGQIASAGGPAVAGEALSMYTTSLADGGVIPPQVAIGGRLAEVLYFGASGYPGYNQVNFRVPDGMPPGAAVSVRLTYLGRSSNAVGIGVQ
jgi:galactose oxidase-like protein